MKAPHPVYGPKLIGLPGRCKWCDGELVLHTPWNWLDAETLRAHQCDGQRTIFTELRHQPQGVTS